MSSLDDSIRHWQEDNVKAETPAHVSMSSSSCALCFDFKEGAEGLCTRCPVYQKTKKTLCFDTPYMKASEELIKWHLEPDNQTLKDNWVKASQAMTDFLIALK